MSDKKISYTNRTFDDYKNALIDYLKENYPQIAENINDASIGSWLIDIMASIGDNLSYHIDRVFGETNINTAQMGSSIYSLARSNGLKVPGPKASIAEEKFTCIIPVIKDTAYDMDQYAPKIKRGTTINSGNQKFEVLNDIDFAEQYDSNGNSNRNVIPMRDSNGDIVSYKVEKIDTVYAGESKIYKQVINSDDVKSFMEIIIPDKEVMEVDSIIFKDGSDYQNDPSMNEFMNPNEFVPAQNSPTGVDTYRFFEVNSLIEQYRWGDDISNTRRGNQNVGKTTTYTYGYYNQDADTIVPTASVTKGEWIPLTQKFVTEFTDNGYLKVIFGSGSYVGQNVDYSKALDFSKNQITKMVRNDFLGKLPKAGWTMYILYRKGGGAASNVAVNTIRNIEFLNMEVGNCPTSTIDTKILASIKNSISATNTTPSVSGKDAPTVDEVRNMIKYNNSSQERCVSVKDYENRINMMPPRYGSPFRVSAIEENNKILLYLLGIDYSGRLTDIIPVQMAQNIINYLSMYRMVNDYVEVKSGKIINLSFECDLYIDKTYNVSDVVSNVISQIREYLDINKHYMGEDLFIGDLEKEISKTDGVLNLIDLRVFNEYGKGYSPTKISQETYSYNEEATSENIPDETEKYVAQVNLDASDYVLNSDANSMFEIKYPEKDIRVKVKIR